MNPAFLPLRVALILPLAYIFLVLRCLLALLSFLMRQDSLANVSCFFSDAVYCVDRFVFHTLPQARPAAHVDATRSKKGAFVPLFH